jgi:hypothetical protein
MQLKYIGGKEMTFYMGHPVKTYRFAPVGEVPEVFAKHILKTRPNEFEIFNPTVEEVIEEVKVEEVKQEKFKCEQCDYESTSNAGLSAHKRFKHKEK